MELHRAITPHIGNIERIKGGLEDGEPEKMTRIWKFAKKGGRSERKKVREEHSNINSKKTPIDRANAFSDYIHRARGAPAVLDDNLHLTRLRPQWSNQEE